MAVELAISYIKNLLTDRAFSYLKEEIERQSGFSSKLDSLQERLLDIKRLLPIAEQKMATNQDLEKLLRDLEDAVYDAEDLLDEFAHPDVPPDPQRTSGGANLLSSCLPYLRQCTSGGANLLRSCLLYLSQQLASYLDVARRVITCDNSTTEITDITEKLDAISKKIETHLNRLNLGASHQLADDGPTATWRIETPFKVEEMIGRDEEKKFLKSMFLSSSHVDGRSNSRNGLSVLSIVGIGGLGKTTLARSLFHDDDVKKEFEPRIWVCVSDDFNLLRLTKEILEGVTGKTVTNNSNLNLLQTDLQKELMGRTFLLVLDDVWEKENENLKRKWNSLLAPLINNSANQESSATKGSKIIVTTRDEEVTKIMGTTKPLRLSTLPVDVFRQLFLSCAFEGANPDDYPAELENMAREIATKLGCLPLAAKTVGALLSSKRDSKQNKEHWRSILESEIWRLPMKENDIMPALRVSYNYLPPHLKQCFAYCAIFPKDYEFDRDYLILHWLAHGYIHPPQNRAAPVEVTGEEYFDDLYRRSFFQPTGRDDDKYVMHDLIHDLAQSVSEHRCFRIEDQKHKEIPKTVRHLSICTDKEVALRQLESFNELKKLRTLVFFHEFVPEIIPKLERVRVLDLAGHAFGPIFLGFPEDIVCLKHLRYLNLSPILCSVLPKQICNLHHLQVLYLPPSEEFFTKLVGLPEGFGNLINLRHLIGNRYAISRITGVHKLKDLQELEAFQVLHEHGHELSELKEMNQIRGSLRIENLDVVADQKEAEEAHLLQKENIRELELVWSHNNELICSHNNDGRADEDVIEGLQPSPSLEKLRISSYNGRSSPSWINMQMLPNLTHVELIGCKKWKVLPPLGQLPYLKHLELCGMDAIKIIGGYEFFGDANFPSLESLVIHDMKALEECRGVEGHQYFPSLRELRLDNCRKLRTLPLLPPKLEVLELYRVGLLSLVSSSMASGDTDGGTPESSDSVSSNRLQVLGLKELRISNCPQLTTLGSFQGLELRDFGLLSLFSSSMASGDTDERTPESSNRLQDLHLEYCTTLEKLDIKRCPKLTTLGSFQGLVSLQDLHLEDCPRLQALPEELHDLSSLRKIYIKLCPKIRSLPSRGLPLGLQEITIYPPIKS